MGNLPDRFSSPVHVAQPAIRAVHRRTEMNNESIPGKIKAIIEQQEADRDFMQ